MGLFRRADIEFTHATSPREVQRKDGRRTNLLEICKEITPPCNLNPLLFNGHIQTMWSATKPTGPPIYYKRRIFTSDNNLYEGSFAVDFVVDPFEEQDPSLYRRITYFSEAELAKIGSQDAKPMLVILHGAAGGSHEVYLRHSVASLVGPDGFEACVVNSRGCAQSEITGSTFFHARGTWDLRQTVIWLKKTFPNRKLFGLGFSLGGNILTHYCGEEGENCLLSAAISCSNPFNFDIASKALQNSFMGRKVYLKALGNAMKKMTITHKQELIKFTNFDESITKRIIYQQDFDKLVQCPVLGYPTVTSYYRDTSSCDAVLAVRIPFLAISARDDPIAVKEALPYEEFECNPNTVLITTASGGHVCWFETGGGRWYTRPIYNFFNYMATEVDLENLQSTPPPTEKIRRGFAFDPVRRKLLPSDGM